MQIHKTNYSRPYGKLYKSGYFHSLNPNAFYTDLNLIAGANNKQRLYKMQKKQQAVFVSRCINMMENKKNGLKVFILTFNSDEIKDPQEYNNRFLANLRKNYKLNSYAWTLELTIKGQFHYHYMVDMPYVKVSKLNDAWGKARKQQTVNAVREFRSVYNTLAAAKYAAKYFSKAKEGKEEYKLIGFEHRLYATSNNLVGNESVPIANPYLFDEIDANASINLENDFTRSGYLQTEVVNYYRKVIEKDWISYQLVNHKTTVEQQ